MQPRVEPLDDRAGVEILDPIEGRRFLLYTDEDVTPTRGDTGSFAFPVSVAHEFVASELAFPYTVTAAVRDAADGSHILDVGYEGRHELEADDYLLEVNAPMKLYLRVESALTVDATTDHIAFEFAGPSRLELGARSHHASPAATVTVPDDPRAAMRAVSTFGSALKTTSCERSWPSLRGHPPRVELGDELSIPDGLDAPDSGVTLHLPPDYEYVFAAAPLAYYFGADLVADGTPRLTVDGGFTYRFDTERGFEDEAIRFLKRAFVLDCVVRTEGFHPMDLHERRLLEADPAVDLDFAALYGAPLGDQLAAYCSVPDEPVREATPTWHRVTHVRPDAETVELLPYVVNDFSLVRVASPAGDSSGVTAADPDPDRAAVNSFKRGLPAAERRDAGVPDPDEYVPLPESDAVERAWVGEGTPVHGAKLLRTAFDRDESDPTDGVVDVTVVCNDEGMREEWNAVSEAYGTGETSDVAPFDVDCRFGVSTDDLRGLLADDHDVFHFVGHVDGRGLQCPDGVVDAETVDRTGATTVLLNACRSHDQGVALVEAGARAAIVSWADVDNHGAVEVGETFARLLDYGFTVGGALEIVEEFTAIGRHYVVVGDPGVTVAQCVDSNPLWCRVGDDADDPPAADEALDVTVTTQTTPQVSIGGVNEPYFPKEDGADFYLIPGKLATFTNTGSELREVIGDSPIAVDVDGTLRWSTEWLDAGEE
ncbi:CHAT domain-containing protein [Halorussus halobius]|uniref:hypothetical protein n=1 Tax=Halorussus halobius TaxID=1710537 RepID=UPI001091BB39|nr:hypothetical protein [Halorussus halobius]